MYKFLVLTLYLFAICSYSLEGQTNYHAVCVGITDYDGASTDITFAAKGAIDMRNMLKNTQGWDRNNIVVLTNDQASAATILQSIQSMPNTRGVTEIFTYSGHGGSDGLETINGNILPSDLQDAFGSNYHQYGVFLGSCQSGKFTNDMTRGEISATCKEDELSLGTGPDTNSAYFAYIFDGLRNNNADPVPGHVISVKDLHAYAAPRTESWVDNKQVMYNGMLINITPQFKSNLGVVNLRPLGPTLSGTLEDDELWDQNVTLNGDVIVDPGKILAFSPGITVNLNGHSIYGGGTIYAHNVALLNGFYFYKGDNVVGVFGNLRHAIENSSPGDTIVIDKPISCSGNSNIPSGAVLQLNAGVTLTVIPGTTLTFANTASFNIYGTLQATNCTFDFTAPNSSIQNGLKFYEGSIPYLSGVIVRNAWYGIYRSGIPTIWGVEAYNCQYGAYIYDNSLGGSTTIQGKFHNNSIGLAIYNLHSQTDYEYVTNCEIYSNSLHGVFCSNSDAVFGNNKIYNNSYHGIYVYNNSYPIIGKQNATGDWQGSGYNSIYNNSSHNLHSEVAGILYAQQNWWGNNPPNYNKMYIANGAIVSSPYLTMPSSSPALAKTTIPVWGESKVTSNKYIDSITSLILANKNIEARNICLDVIKSFPDSSFAHNIVNLLRQTYSDKERNICLKMYRNLFNELTNKELAIITGVILARLDSANRSQILDELIDNYKDYAEYELALYNKFLYCFNEENNLTEARHVLNELDKLFPMSSGTLDAHMMIGDKTDYDKYFGAMKYSGNNSERTIDNFIVYDNRPNPFNPATTITFCLPETGYVIVKIYDIMGREVSTLLNEVKDKGYHSIVWDSKNYNGNDVSSGIYLYNVRFNNNSVTKKMLLVR